MRDKRTASEKEEPNMSSQAIEAIMELPVSVPDMKPGPWNVDTAHSSLEFTAKHMVFTTVHGRFDEFDATVVVDPEPSKSHVEVTIKADSISTGNPDRDTHLKSPDFLDVESYPELTFKSTALDDINPEAGTFTLKGGFTVLDQTVPIALDVEFNGLMDKDLWGNPRASFTATGSFSRKDWGLTWNKALETGGFLVSDKVNINIEIALVRKAGE
ncbi:MAG TPA: polyisoprenoid-binding protein [Actinobacteria bacterium]|nr:polyisoprenoid-binding protein [Actinomycetota bacterium]